MNINQTPGGKNQSKSINPLPRRDRMSKRWKTAQSRSPNSAQARTNGAVEAKFNDILTDVKQMLGKNSQTVFERDLRHDNSEDAFGMHAFLCSSFYFFLECELDFNYQVEYAFHNCPNEQVIRRMLSCFPLNERAKEVELKPDFATFFKAVINIQDKKYITIL